VLRDARFRALLSIGCVVDGIKKMPRGEHEGWRWGEESGIVLISTEKWYYLNQTLMG